MAGISYNIASAAVNPTSERIPVNISGQFVDSNIQNRQDTYVKVLNGAGINEGLGIDLGTKRYFIGDALTANNGTFLAIDDATRKISLGGTITQGTSGSVSGQHLKLYINGTLYVIELKNP